MTAAGTRSIKPPALAGFDSIYRSWEPLLKCWCARILPGEFYVTEHDEALSTVLGSCISACIRDPKSGFGGMNHFMLPAEGSDDGKEVSGTEARYGTYAMECLINEIQKRGASRRQLEVKIVGGGQINSLQQNIGERNIQFVLDFLRTEGLTVKSQDLGGTSPRRVQYFPKSGRLRVKHLASVQVKEVERAEQEHQKTLTAKPKAGSVELF